MNLSNHQITYIRPLGTRVEMKVWVKEMENYGQRIAKYATKYHI